MEEGDSMFDFIIYELEELAKRHLHRIRSIVTTLKNNKKTNLLDVVNELNTEVKLLAEKHDFNVLDICNNARYHLDGNQYNINLIQFYDKHGDSFDDIEDD